MGKELDKLIQMGRARAHKHARQPVRGILMPVEFRKALEAARRGNPPGSGVHVLLKKIERNRLKKIARELDIPFVEFLRVVLRSVSILGPKGVKIFVNAANRAEGDPKAKPE